MLSERNTNLFKRDSENVINGPEGYQDSGSLPNRGNSLQENEVRNIDNGNNPTRRDGLVKSIEILSGELNARLSQEMDSQVRHKHKSLAFSLASNDRVIPEIRSIIRHLPLDQNGKRNKISISISRFPKWLLLINVN